MTVGHESPVNILLRSTRSFQELTMKKILFGALVIGSAFTVNSAFAGQSEDAAARASALEKENAAIRRENRALLENKSLRERNTDLKAADSQPVAQAPAA